MTTWNYINIVLCILLLAFLCWNELRRTNRSRLVLRIVASVLAVASIAFLILPLNQTIKENKVLGTDVVLLTEGFSEDSLSLFLKGKTGTPVFAIDKEIINAGKKYKTAFLSISDIDGIKKRGDALHIFGYGTDREDLSNLEGTSLVFHPVVLKDGITAINWQHHIKSGDQLKVQGNFRNLSTGEITMIFSGDGTNLDTALIPAKGNGDFELTAVPKQFGKSVYSISAISGKDTLEKEPIPFETELPGKLRVLVLAASPDFDNKFLKTWLSENNSSLVTRAKISKDKYEKTFLNTDLTSLTGITSSFLNNFDLLIADASELVSISKPELSAIESQVAQKGMGLIVNADSALSRGPFFARQFPLHQHPDNHKKEISVFIPATNGYAAALIAEHPLYIEREPGTRTLIEDRESNAVVSGTIYGKGRIIFTTLKGTFTWMLSGDSKNYSAYWSYLLEQALAKTGTDGAWMVSPAFPKVNESVTLHYSSNDAAIPQVQVGSAFLYMAQDPDLPFQWTGNYWPTKTGWQPVMQEGKAPTWWYAYNSDDWKPISFAERMRSTREGIKNILEKKASAKAEQKSESVPVNKIYFFILFLLCAGFLWIERKL